MSKLYCYTVLSLHTYSHDMILGWRNTFFVILKKKKTLVHVKHVTFHWFVWKNIIILTSHCKIKNIIKRKCTISAAGNACNMAFIELFLCQHDIHSMESPTRHIGKHYKRRTLGVTRWDSLTDIKTADMAFTYMYWHLECRHDIHCLTSGLPIWHSLIDIWMGYKVFT